MRRVELLGSIYIARVRVSVSVIIELILAANLSPETHHDESDLSRIDDANRDSRWPLKALEVSDR